MSCLISKALESVTRSATEAQSPCVCQLSAGWAGLGWRVAAAQLRAALPHAWAGPGNELSPWEPGDPARNVAGSISALCLLQAKVSPLRGWRGTAFPCGTGDGACKGLQPELL